MTNIYNWVVSFELPIRRLTRCQRKALQKSEASRLRTLIAKQVTDVEKLIITTIDTSLTADLLDSGTYILDDLKTLLAKHIARFDAVYSHSSSARIMRYLCNRARDFQVDPSFAKTKSKGKGKPPPSAAQKRTYSGTQRSWRVSEQHIQTATPCTNQHCVTMNTPNTLSIEDCRNKSSRLGTHGKGKGNGKGKGKGGKGRGKGTKGMSKGKGKGKSFKGGPSYFKGGSSTTGLQLPMKPAKTSSASSGAPTNAADVTCYFCHQKRHYKSQCPKW
jgi:hypothetical protein